MSPLAILMQKISFIYCKTFSSPLQINEIAKFDLCAEWDKKIAVE